MRENSDSLQDMVVHKFFNVIFLLLVLICVKLQQQARKLAHDFQIERQKLEDAHRSEKNALDDKILRMKNNEEVMRGKMKDHIESNYQDLIRKHQSEVFIYFICSYSLYFD